MPESELRGYLRGISESLAKRADVIWGIALAVQEHASKINDSSNGPIHCQAVETNVFRLLYESGRLQIGSADPNAYPPHELFLLSVAAACHDFDKGLPPAGLDHGEGSGCFVFANRDKLALDLPEATAVDFIISVHGFNDAEYARHLRKLPSRHGFSPRPVDLQRLAVVFKAADILQCNGKRVSTLAVDTTKLAAPDRTKALARQCTSDWSINGDCVVVDAFPTDVEQHVAICRSSIYMKEHEWSPLSREFHHHRLPHRLEFRISPRYLAVPAPETSVASRDLPGMDHYRAADAPSLSGRDGEIKDVMELVLGHEACALVGPSGVGKSSLLHAGLLPLISAMEGWHAVVTRPENTTGSFFTPADFAEIAGISLGPETSFSDLCRLSLRKSRNLVIMFDQFEDIAYHDAIDVHKLVGALLDATREASEADSGQGLRLLFSYRDDAESLLRPVFNAYAHAATGLPTYALQLLSRDNAKASMEKLLRLKQLALSPHEPFLELLLDQLASASLRDSRFVSGAIYPPYIQMVLDRLGRVATDRGVALASFEALAEGDGEGRTSTDIAVAEYLDDAISGLDKTGLSPAVARVLLTAMVCSTGGKSSASTQILAEEARISDLECKTYLAALTRLRLVRRLASGEHEVIHDHLAQRLVNGLSLSDRAFKQAKESLQSRAVTYHQHFGWVSPQEVKTLWIQRARLRPGQLTAEENLALLLAMAAVAPSALADAAHPYSDNVDENRVRFTNPASWSAPGWYWLAALDARRLLHMARLGAESAGTPGAVAYLRVAILVGTDADVVHLLDVLKGPFATLPKLAEDTIECVASLATEASLPFLRGLTQDNNAYARRAAAKAIGKVGTARDLTTLANLVSDAQPNPAVAGDCDVRGAAAEAIGQMGLREGVAILREMADDQAHEVQIAVAKAIAKAGDESDLPVLRQLAGRNYLPTCFAAAKAYAELATGSDLETLRDAAKGSDDLMREGAAWVLKERGGAEDLVFLRQLLETGTLNCQYAAVAAIGHLGDDQDLPALREIVRESSHWPLRRSAVRAIGQLRSRTDLDLLLEVAAKDAVPHLVGKAAARASWQVHTRQDVPVLLRAIRGRQSNHQAIEAIQTLGRLFSDAEVFTEMEQFMVDAHTADATAAAEVAVPQTSATQLTEYLASNQQNLPPQTLAVFDWHLYAPAGIKEGHARWEKEHRRLNDRGW